MNFEGFPTVLGLELTLACNLRCKHCASSAGEARNTELDLQELLAICDQFPDLLVQEVDITGGEPLMRREWFDVACHLSDLGIPVRMVSNGVLLKDNIPQLAEAKIATVGISLDGLEQTHDFIRGRPGLFRSILAGIEEAMKAGIPIAVITAVNNLNADELPELHDFLKKTGIYHWQVQPIFARGRATEFDLDLSDSTYLRLGEFIRNNRTPGNDPEISMMPADGVGYYTALDTREKEWTGCGAGVSTCGITSDGKIKGCLSMPDHLIEGDLREKDLWEIWFDKKSFAYNRLFALDDLGDNCKGCSHGKECRGGCSVMSYASTGQFHNDPYCFQRILANEL